LRRTVDALSDIGEDDRTAVLRALGVEGRRQGLTRDTPRTPLPLPGGSSGIQSEVEWV
jgi:hypothetical protein